MANKNIDDLPTATSLNAGDKLEILQGGTNKQIDSSLLGAVQSVTGPQVDNTDPLNPVVLAQTQLISPDGNTSVSSTDGEAETASNDGGTNSAANTVTPLQVKQTVNDGINLVETKATINGFAVEDYAVTASQPIMLDAAKRIKGLTAAIWGAFISALTSKTTPVDADSIAISDSAASGTAKKVSLTNFKAFLKTYFDTIYLALTGGSMTGALNEAKGTNIASATTTDIGAATGNLIHITGTTTITSFGTIQAGTKRSLVFDGILILTNSANIILPGNVSLTTGVDDTAIFVSEGGGVWRCLSYFKYDESYTNYTPSFTGFSVPPTVTAGDARWKMLSKNTCHVIIYTGNGTSNATTMTVTLPFTAASNGASSLQAFATPVLNNGNHVIGTLRTQNASNIANVYNGIIGASFTASGSKSAYISIVYQISI